MPNVGVGKVLRYRSQSVTFLLQNFSIFLDGIGLQNYLVLKKKSVSVSNEIGIGKNIGNGFKDFWYQ